MWQVQYLVGWNYLPPNILSIDFNNSFKVHDLDFLNNPPNKIFIRSFVHVCVSVCVRAFVRLSIIIHPFNIHPFNHLFGTWDIIFLLGSLQFTHNYRWTRKPHYIHMNLQVSRGTDNCASIKRYMLHTSRVSLKWSKTHTHQISLRGS